MSYHRLESLKEIEMAETVDFSKIKNENLVLPLNKLVRFVKEVQKSDSGGRSNYGKKDLERLREYLGAFNKALDWVKGAPELDCPVTSPDDYAIEPLPEEKEMESEEVKQVLRLLRRTWKELAGGQSAGNSYGIHVSDDLRCRDLIAKITAFLDNYVVPLDNMDYPETGRDVESTP